ncbi:hypothetical protein [Dactylosporangium sp. NPDC048998]|uniref:hypothetical protein n=1 Tax=Dactylosporangium sp. NPDC048998 TaxID=3363976 RepID=UPI00371318AA
MDIGPVLRSLATSARLPVKSTASDAMRVHVQAKQTAADTAGTPYMKAPTPVPVDAELQTSPGDVLRELGVATTFLTRSRFLSIAQHWAHVRYCSTLRAGRGRLLALTRSAAREVVYHHKVAQSEQLGIGLALIVARAVLHKRHPGWTFQAVDADVALRHGYIDDVTGEVRNEPGTKKRPDYFLVGRRTDGKRTDVRIVVLECKGSHGGMRDIYKQLADACLQVQTVAIGDHPLYGLMVASRLAYTGVHSYVFDPPGDDELWSGPSREFDELMNQTPEEFSWRSGQLSPTAPQAEQPPDSASTPPSRATAPSHGSSGPIGAAAPYVIPDDRRTWLAQVLSRTTAASVLLFAGDSSTAAGYTTARQRDHNPGMLPLEEPWPDTISGQLRIPTGPVLNGTSYLMPLSGGRTLVMFRGIERRLHHALKEGNLQRYLRDAGRLHRWWRAHPQRPRELLSVGTDGTALLARVVNERVRPQSSGSRRTGRRPSQ